MKPSSTTEGTGEARKPSEGSEKRSTEAGKSLKDTVLKQKP